jgi:hypothetical protein
MLRYVLFQFGGRLTILMVIYPQRCQDRLILVLITMIIIMCAVVGRALASQSCSCCLMHRHDFQNGFLLARLPTCEHQHVMSQLNAQECVVHRVSHGHSHTHTHTQPDAPKRINIQMTSDSPFVQGDLRVLPLSGISHTRLTWRMPVVPLAHLGNFVYQFSHSLLHLARRCRGQALHPSAARQVHHNPMHLV